MVGRLCKVAMRLRFLRPARWLRQTIYGLKDCYWSKYTLSNKELLEAKRRLRI